VLVSATRTSILAHKVQEKEHPKGVILRFEGVGENQTRETLRPIFEAYGHVAYIDFEQNKAAGYLQCFFFIFYFFF
jgi:hypothetical protein